MRSLLILLISMLPMLVACEKASDLLEDYLNKGTNIGYMKCLEKNKNTGVADYVIEKLCRKKHEQLVNAELDGTAGYKWKYDTLCTFSVHLNNKSKDVIITFVEIYVNDAENKDKKGKPITEKLKIENLWIEPYQSSDFEAYDLKFKPKKDRIETEEKVMYKWGISQIRGIKIKLQ